MNNNCKCNSTGGCEDCREEIRQLDYKKVKKTVPSCPTCEEELRGDNSYMCPYQCKCGTWEYIQYGENQGNFMIK